jgi:hypothetical protein
MACRVRNQRQAPDIPLLIDMDFEAQCSGLFITNFSDATCRHRVWRMEYIDRSS